MEERSMHDMLLARNIIDIIEQVMTDNGVTEVLTCYIKAGKMALVTPDSLQCCFAILTTQTKLAGSRLDIEVVPLEYYCLNCHREIRSEDMILHCPYCDGKNLILQRGRCVAVEGIDVRDTDT
jgi:hydrogenase nickel incorporation protein HypA/HybF